MLFEGIIRSAITHVCKIQVCVTYLVVTRYSATAAFLLTDRTIPWVDRFNYYTDNEVLEWQVRLLNKGIFQVSPPNPGATPLINISQVTIAGTVREDIIRHERQLGVRRRYFI